MRRAWAGSEKFNKESSRDTASVPNLREYYHVHSLIVWNTCCELEKHIDETAHRIIEELDEQCVGWVHGPPGTHRFVLIDAPEMGAHRNVHPSYISPGPGLAQLGARLAGCQKVRGSSPLSSTRAQLAGAAPALLATGFSPSVPSVELRGQSFRFPLRYTTSAQRRRTPGPQVEPA